MTRLCQHFRYGVGIVAVLALLAACGSRPAASDWSLNASDAAQRAMSAQLEGAQKVAALEWSKARSEAGKTGEPARMARLALMRCALQVASLEWSGCSAYAPYAQDAAAAEQAYHRYLYGGLQAADVALLPAQHREVAQAVLQGTGVTAVQLHRIAQPQARLVASGVALRAGGIALADAWPVVDTVATAQGWRWPLSAWMELERRRLVRNGSDGAAHMLERRQAVLGWQPGP